MRAGSSADAGSQSESPTQNAANEIRHILLPGKSAKRVSALDVAVIQVFLA
jgi:hypothetical protein